MAQPTSAAWLHSAFSCTDIGACCGGFWCGACIFGRGQHRLQNFPSTPEESSFSWCNSSCAIMACATCFLLPGLPVWQQRAEIRRTFKLGGNGCLDCLGTWLCTCCTVVQQENEVRERAEMARSHDNGYRAGPATMMYHVQQPQVQGMATQSTPLPPPMYDNRPPPSAVHAYPSK